MKGKQLLILAVTAAVLAGIAAMTSRKEYKAPPSRIGSLIFKDIDVNTITSIRITKGEESITMSKKDNTWVCNDRHDYPVKFDRIKDLVLKISEMKIGQVPSVDDNLRESMNLTPPESGGSGTLVELLASEGSTVASILIGSVRQSSDEIGFRGMPEGTFVSDDNGATAYLVKDSFHHATPAARGWLQTEVLNVAADSIKKLSISRKGGTSLDLNEQDGKLVVSGLTESEITNAGTVSSLRSGLTSLHMDDVADPDISNDDFGLDNAITYRAETDDGIIYNVVIGNNVKGAEERYVRISAELKPAPVGDNDEDKAAREALEIKTAAINEKLSKWTFELATYKTDNLVSTREGAVSIKPTERKKEE